MKPTCGRLIPTVVIVFAVLAGTPHVTKAQEQEEDTTEEATTWTASARANYINNDISRGVDMSNDLAAVHYGAKLEHESGFSLDAGAANLLGSGGGFEQWYASLGYSHAVSSSLVLSGELSHFKYANDSLNAIANLSNSITLGATIQTALVNIGLSYNTYFGGGTANYFGLNFDKSMEHGDFTFDPSLSFSFISQTIDQKRLASYKKFIRSLGKGGSGRGPGSTSSTTSSAVTVTGLSGVTLAVDVSYDLGNGFTLEAQPSYVNSPKAELASNTSQFLWSVGISYAKEF